MSAEKLFTVVGTAVNPNGQTKVRWANDLVSRIKTLSKAGCTEISLIELPEGMTKLAAAEYYLANTENVSDAAREILEAKIAEKSKAVKSTEVKATLTSGKSKPAEKAPAKGGFVDTKVEA